MKDLDGKIYVIDSLRTNKPLINVLKIQLCQLYATDQTKNMSISIPSVQQQLNSSDCGLFSIAFVTELLHSNYALNTNVRFQISQLRPHLIKCLEKGKLDPFPKIAKMPKMPSNDKEVRITVYCHCKLPGCIDNLISCENKKCSNITKWFHVECVDKTNANEKWCCDVCRPKNVS